MTANGTVGGKISVPVVLPNPAAESDWRALQSLLAPPTAIKGKPADIAARLKTPAEQATERNARADHLLSVAQQAKAFHTRHPKDPKAAQARKLEVTASLDSARLGKAAAEAPALALAAAYRKNKNELREHRFEVALAADRYRLRKSLGEKTAREKPQEHEKLADDLRKEFGPIPEVFGLYTGIAAELDMAAANRLAGKILEMRPPAFAKAEAQAITTRFGLLGRPLALKLTSLEGRKFETATPSSSAAPTVVYVWTPMIHAASRQATHPFAELDRKATLPGAASAQWIYVGLGVKPAEASAAKAKAPFPGTHCVEAAGPTSAVAQRLKVRTSPTVFVLDAKGVLTGFGRVDELPALLAAANR